ncbi:MAG TPA: hypothetical protein VHK69_17050, partial [Chitinophagaceae bacterium]|nr:hypothetical protein [Chitinophagaceae bacterium]
LTGNPYKGLLSYEPEDCRRFFGRKEAVAALFRKVEGSSLVAVVGPSGSGKSSLVKAGLLPRLEAQGFHTICVKPEDVLLTARAEAGSASAFHFAGLEQQLYGQGHEKVALYIDQFEQLITRCQEDHLRRSFIDFITTTQNRSAGTLPAVIKVILTVRTDYEFQFDFFFPNWAQHKFNVPPLLESDYREIITEPAYHAGLSFSPAYLVDVILRDVKQSNGTLPLLSYTLFQMCEEYKEEQHAGFLTEDLYNQVGGVIGGLRAKAEQIYNSYPPDDPHRRTIRNVMLRMITGSGEIAGRKVYERDLVYTSMEENKRVQHVLNAFIDSRLVITDKDKYTNQVYYEPAHDSLVKNWIELSKWASDKEGKEYFYYAPSLKEAMKEEGQWKLWSEDPRLNVLASTLKSEHSWLNHTEAQFIQDSIREQRRKKRKKQGMALAVAFTILLLMIFNFQSRSAKQRAELDKEKSIEKAKGDLARLQKDSVDAKNKILDSLNKQLGKESAYNKKLYETAEEGRVKVKELNVLLENKRDSLEQTNKSLAKAFKDLDSTNKKLANNVYELKIANSKNQMLLREPFARSFDTATVNRFIDTLLTLQFDPHRKDEYDNTAAFQNVKSILNRIAKASDSARKNPNTGFILAKQTYDSVQEMKLTGFARRVVDSIGLGIANDNLFYTHKAELAYKLGSRIYLTAVSRDQSRFAFATVNGVHTGKIVKDTLQLDRQMPGREATTEGQPGLPGTYQNRVRYTALQYIDSNLLIGVTDGNEVHTWKPDHAYPAVRKGPDSFDPTVTRLAAVSPDGKIVLRTTNDSTVGILHNREPAEEEPWPQSFGAGAKVRNLIYHPAGHHALVLTDQDQCWILDIARKQSRRLDIQPVYAAGFAADGPYILYEGKEVFGLADLSGVRAGNTLSKNSLGLGGAPRSINLTLSRSWTSLVVQNELMENLFFEGWNPEGKRDSLFYF